MPWACQPLSCRSASATLYLANSKCTVSDASNCLTVCLACMFCRAKSCHSVRSIQGHVCLMQVCLSAMLCLPQSMDRFHCMQLDTSSIQVCLLLPCILPLMCAYFWMPSTACLPHANLPHACHCTSTFPCALDCGSACPSPMQLFFLGSRVLLLGGLAVSPNLTRYNLLTHGITACSCAHCSLASIQAESKVMSARFPGSP